jgi:hypothetical protein
MVGIRSYTQILRPWPSTFAPRRMATDKTKPRHPHRAEWRSSVDRGSRRNTRRDHAPVSDKGLSEAAFEHLGSRRRERAIPTGKLTACRHTVRAFYSAPRASVKGRNDCAPPTLLAWTALPARTQQTPGGQSAPPGSVRRQRAAVGAHIIPRPATAPARSSRCSASRAPRGSACRASWRLHGPHSSWRQSRPGSADRR